MLKKKNLLRVWLGDSELAQHLEAELDPLAFQTYGKEQVWCRPVVLAAGRLRWVQSELRPA